MADASSVACVVVTYDALPWIEQCLESVEGIDTVVVDNGSSDGTVDVVRERFPQVRVIEAENRGLCAGWNRGIAATGAEHVLVLNADAWLVEDALDALLAAAERHPRAAVIGPRLLNPDGSLQRSVRGFPTRGGSRPSTSTCASSRRASKLNAFYGAGFDHERAGGRLGDGLVHVRAAGRVRRRRPLRRAVLPLQRGGRLDAPGDRSRLVRRLHARGALRPRRRRLARRAPVPENVRGNLRYLSLHGRPGEAERARRMLRASLAVRGASTAARAALPRGRGLARLGRRRVVADELKAAPAIGERGSVAAP